MNGWVNVGIYVLALAGSCVVNAAILSYIAGRKTQKVDDLETWKNDHEKKFERVSREVAYLSGKVNGGNYKHIS